MVPARESRFHLAVSAEQFLEYYRGVARQVVVRAADGRTLQFPASILRPFLDQTGIYGDFVIRFDSQNKLVDIRRA